MTDILAIYEPYTYQFLTLINAYRQAVTINRNPDDLYYSRERINVRQGIAYLSIDAPIFSERQAEYYGFCTVDQIRRDIQTALDDSQVRTIVIAMDCPGGSITGIQELSAFIARANQQKSIITYVEGLCCSAAYWIAAPTTIYAAPTSLIGSIGIVQTFIKYDAGVMREINVVSTHAPDKKLDPEKDEQRLKIIQTLDALEAIFIADVANSRDITPQTVIDTYGQGGVYVGEKAAHMVDGVVTLNQLYIILSTKGTTMKQTAAQTPENFGGFQENFELMRDAFNELVKRAETQENRITQLENERVVRNDTIATIGSVFAMFDGDPHQAEYQRLKAECLSQQLTFQQTLEKIKTLRGQLATAKTVVNTGNAHVPTNEQKLTFMDLVVQIKKSGKTVEEAMRTVAEQHPELYEEYHNQMRDMSHV